MNRSVIPLAYGSRTPRWQRVALRVGIVIAVLATITIARSFDLFDESRACGKFPVNVHVVGSAYKQMNYLTSSSHEGANGFAQFMMQDSDDAPKATLLNGSTSQIEVPVSYIKPWYSIRAWRYQHEYAAIAITLLNGRVVTRAVKLPNNSSTPVVVTIDKVDQSGPAGKSISLICLPIGESRLLCTVLRV